MSTAALLIGSPPGLATYAAGCGTGDARGIVAQPSASSRARPMPFAISVHSTWALPNCRSTHQCCSRRDLDAGWCRMRPDHPLSGDAMNPRSPTALASSGRTREQRRVPRLLLCPIDRHFDEIICSGRPRAPARAALKHARLLWKQTMRLKTSVTRSDSTNGIYSLCRSSCLRTMHFQWTMVANKR